MGLFRKLKKLIDLHIPRDEDPRRIAFGRRQMREEARPPNGEYGPIPRSLFNAVDSARQQAGFDPLPVFVQGSFQSEEDRLNQELEAEFAAMDRNRSKSADRLARPGSSKNFRQPPPATPNNFRQPPPGTPIKFRRRPASPELLQPSASSPFFFRQHSLPSSPEMLRRFQQQQQFQHMARQQQQQQQQQQHDMMMAHPQQFYPQFQQPFYPMMNPNVNMQGWFMMPQQQMYPFY
jgi:hypothetical protein